MREKRNSESKALAALATEAKRRGMTYGQLVAGTSEQEREKIVELYLKGRRPFREEDAQEK